jgi:hypothetical protein
MGVPIIYSNGDLTFKNDQTAAGIYCVTGNIKLQSRVASRESRVAGAAVLLATGTITTSGDDQQLSTAWRASHFAQSRTGRLLSLRKR